MPTILIILSNLLNKHKNRVYTHSPLVRLKVALLADKLESKSFFRPIFSK